MLKIGEDWPMVMGRLQPAHQHCLCSKHSKMRYLCGDTCRVMRRRVKLNAGEDSEDRSGDDRDSGNERQLKKAKKPKKRSRGMFGAFWGMGGGAYDPYGLF